MGGKVHDRRTLVVDRNPLRQLAVEVGKFPKLTPAAILQAWIKAFEDYGLDALEELTGLDLTALKTVLDRFSGAFEGIDIIGGGPGAVLTAIGTTIKDKLRAVVLGEGVADGSTLPSALPLTLGAPPDDVTRFFTAIRRIWPADLTDPDFDLEATIAAFITDRLRPRNILAELTDVTAVDNRVNDVVDALLTGLRRGIPVFGGTIADLLEKMLALANDTDVALSPANPATVDIAARVRVLESSGSSDFYDLVDDRTALGADYVVLSGAPVVTNDFVRAGFSSTIAFRRAVEFSSSKHYFQVRLRLLGQGISRIGIMSAADASSFAGVEISVNTFDDYMQMISGTSVSAATARNATLGGRYVPDGGWRQNDIVGVGYNPDTHRYEAYRNDDLVAYWADDAGVVPTVAGKRYALVILNTRPDFNPTGVDNLAGYVW